jgi:uncharacterized membrane protein HdeD (DUF308 family)
MKPWYKSKTIWFNLSAGVVGVVAASVQAFAPFMSATHLGLFSLVVAAANVALRVITTEGVTTSKD